MTIDYSKIDQSFFYGEDHQYIVSYKDLQGGDAITQMKAKSKEHAERKFGRKANSLCKVTKVETILEWIDSTSAEVVHNSMNKVRYLEDEIKEGKLLFG
jgi:hypothetical protein